MLAATVHRLYLVFSEDPRSIFNPQISILIIVKVTGTKSNFWHICGSITLNLSVSQTKIPVNLRCGSTRTRLGIRDLNDFPVQLFLLRDDFSLLFRALLISMWSYDHIISSLWQPHHLHSFFDWICLTLIIEVDLQQTLSSYGHYITLSLYNNIHIHDSHWVCNMFTYFSAPFVQTFNLPCSPLLSSRQFFSFLVLLHRKMKLSNHFIIFFELL